MLRQREKASKIKKTKGVVRRVRKTKLVGRADICIADRDEEGGHETKRRGIFRADGGSGRCL